MSNQRSVPEFSRLVQLKSLEIGGRNSSLNANDTECVALAERLGLHSISDFWLDVSSERTCNGRTKLNVNYSANVIQLCIVSLEPVSERLADQFSVLCEIEGMRPSGQGAQLDVDGEVLVDPFGEDVLVFFDEDEIDVGELATQYMSLALNPYPRAAGIEEKLDLAYPEEDSNSIGAEKVKENPFSILAFQQGHKENNNCT